MAEIEALRSQEEAEALELEIKQLEEELRPLKHEVQRLVKRQTVLENQVAVGKKKSAQMERLLATRRDSFSKTLSPKLSHRSAQLGRLSNSLETSTAQIVDFYASALSNAGSQLQRSPFLSTSSWVDYNIQDERYSKQVRLYLRRLMSTNSATSSPPTRPLGDQSSTSEDNNASHFSSDAGNHTDCSSRYHWKGVANPKEIRFAGVDAETHARQSTELARLRDLYAPSEKAKTAAELELARRNAEIETCKLQLINSAGSAPNGIDEVTYKQRARELQKKYARLQTMLARNVEVILPELYSELAKLQSTPILWADYNLKLSRLHLQRVKIDLVVSSLLKQKSKSVLLSWVLNNERNQHVALNNMLNVIHRETSKLARNWNNRAAHFRLRCAQPSSSPQLEHFRILSQMLLENGLTLNIAKLERAVADLGEKKRNVSKMGENRASKETSELAKIKKSIDIAHNLVYKDSIGKQPIQTPPEIAQACRKMDSATAALASSMEVLLKNFTSKSQAIAELPREARFERDLWTYFFTGKSAAVKVAFDNLNSKIKANTVATQ